MATIRRPRKTKKEVQVELLAPEIVEEKLWSLSEWVEKHWKPVLGGIGAVTLLWGGAGVASLVAESRANSRADASATVFQLAAKAVVPPQDEPKAPEGEAGKDEAAAKEEAAKKKAAIKDSFDSETLRAQAVVAAGKVDDETAAPWVNVVVGGAKAVTGDYAAQLTAVDAALPKVTGQALELPLREQRAVALAGLGKSADAAAEWAKVAQLSVWPFDKALAQLRMGDLFNPGLGSKAADAAKAKAAYEEAVKLARPGDKDPPAGALAWVAADARAKLASL